MNRITIYILRQLLVGSVLVTAGFLCVLWLTQGLRFIELIASDGLSILVFLHLTVLLLPKLCVLILPVSAFVVVLFTYNRLSVDQELVVLRAVGGGPFDLAKPALILGMGLTVLGYVFSFWLGPQSIRAFKDLQWTIRHDISQALIQEGIFNSVSPGITVYVREQSSGNELTGILVHDTRDPDHVVTLMAEKGILVKTASRPGVLLVNGSRQEVDREKKTLSLLNFERYSMDIGGWGDAPGQRDAEVSERSLSELLSAGKYPGVSEATVRRFGVEAHQRILQPLFSVLMPLFSLAFLFSGTFSRRGNVGRILGAITCVIVFEAAFLGISSLASRNLSFIPLMYGITFLPLLIFSLILFGPGMSVFFSPRERS